MARVRERKQVEEVKEVVAPEPTAQPVSTGSAERPAMQQVLDAAPEGLLESIERPRNNYENPVFRGNPSDFGMSYPPPRFF